MPSWPCVKRYDHARRSRSRSRALRSALNISNLRYQGWRYQLRDVLLAKRNLFDAEFALRQRTACTWLLSSSSIKRWVEDGRQPREPVEGNKEVRPD